MWETVRLPPQDPLSPTLSQLCREIVARLQGGGKSTHSQAAKWMGHSTMEMRELYQHVFPQDGVEQISLLS